LRGLVIGDTNCGTLAKALNKNKTLFFLNLSKNDITLKGAERLSRGLQDSALVQLDLSHNPLGDAGIRALADYVSHSQSQLKKLVLSNTKFGKAGGQTLFRAVSMAKHLQHLNVAGNCFSQQNMDRVPFCLQYGPLTTLDISNCALGGSAMATIGFILRRSGLKVLLAADNNCGDKAVSAFADSLAQGCELHTLVLSSNYLTDIGGAHVAAALSTNTLLAKLMLDSNQLTSASGELFKTVLATNKSITHLGLENNKCISLHITDAIRSLVGRNAQLATSKLIPDLEHQRKKFGKGRC
jgi:Ran GTPase-activating protein (RanGAP) involved in mRNA processing and transport